jgi:hypothetical protein
MDSQLILNLHHIIIAIVVLFSAIFSILKVYLNFDNQKNKEYFNKEITNTRLSINKEYKNELITMSERYIQELGDVKREQSTDSIKNKVRDYIESEHRVLNNDISSIKQGLVDIKLLLHNQQEQMLVMQTAITELKPKVNYLDDRITKIENKIDAN